MKIEIPKIVAAFDLGQYALEMGGQQIYVWVNPPRSLLKPYYDSLASLRKCLNATPGQPPVIDGVEINVAEQIEKDALKMRSVLAELISQGPPDTHWTEAELLELAAQSEEADPHFYPWFIDRIFEQIVRHRNGEKKA